MALTVNAAFDEFLSNTVNLDPEETKKARKSRDWLFGQISAFQSDATFPILFPANNISFGSFARRTKRRPLDDIDLMICFHAQYASYLEYNGRIEITANANTNLKALCNENTNILNSTKVINKFISKCRDVPQYSKADLKRNGAAAVLSLVSYDWCFDIVPCFMTAEEWNGRTYYLIPDGYGNWKKTDPRIDRDRTQRINQNHDGNVLNVIKTIKYWNGRPTMPSIPRYLLETMILNYYSNRLDKASKFVDLEIPKVLEFLSTYIYCQVNDPKNIQGDINNISWDEQTKIANRAISDKQKADVARNLETNQDHEGPIQKWGEILGGSISNIWLKKKQILRNLEPYQNITLKSLKIGG